MRLLPFCSPSRRMARRGGGRDRLHGPFKHLQSLVLCTSFSYTTEYFIVWLVFFMQESCVGLWMLGSFAKWGGGFCRSPPCSPKWYCLAGLYQNTSVNPRSNDSKTWHLSCGQMWDVLLAHRHDGEKKIHQNLLQKGWLFCVASESVPHLGLLWVPRCAVVKRKLH